MNKSIPFVIGTLLTAVLLAALTSAEATTTAPPDSVERALLGLNATETRNELLPDFGPEVFERIKQDPKVLATYGKIPIIKIETQKRNWLESLGEVTKGIRTRINSYLYPAGPLVGYGHDREGYIFVTFKDNSSKILMDEIYKVLYDQAMQRGVPEVPVVFESGNLPQLDNSRSNSTEIYLSLDIQKINNIEYNYFYPQIPSNYEVITTYGKLPELETEAQRQNWSNALDKVEKSLATEIFFNYIDSNGKVLTYGENSRGYFVIVFDKNLTIEKPLLGELYAIIDKNAKKIGIKEVPVEFGHGVIPLKLEVDDEPAFLNYSFHSNLDLSAAMNFSDNWSKTCGACHGGGTQSVINQVGSYKPVVIAVYGKLPKFETEEQRLDWANRVQPAIIGGLGSKIVDSYFYPKGPLVIFGTNYPNGYFEATVLKNLTIEKPLMDEIYGIIDEEAKKRDIQEVPVRFILGDFARPLDDKATPPSRAESDKSVPGFVFMGGLISLLGIWLFRRR